MYMNKSSNHTFKFLQWASILPVLILIQPLPVRASEGASRSPASDNAPLPSKKIKNLPPSGSTPFTAEACHEAPYSAGFTAGKASVTKEEAALRSQGVAAGKAAGLAAGQAA